MIAHRIAGPAGLAFIAAISLAAPSHAAVITWGSATNQTGNLSDFVTTGSLVSAITADTTVTVDGITFIGPASANPATFPGSQITLTGIDTAVYHTSGQASPPGGFNASYATLVDRGAYSMNGNGSNALHVGGLTIGQDYTLQIFVPWWDTDWTTYFNDGSANSPALNAGSREPSTAQYIIGTFTADAATESLTIRSNTPVALLAAVQLRTSGDETPAPEPTTLAILGSGLLALAHLRRRKTARV